MAILSTEYQNIGSVSTYVAGQYPATVFQILYAKYSRNDTQIANNKSTVYFKVETYITGAANTIYYNYSKAYSITSQSNQESSATTRYSQNLTQGTITKTAKVLISEQSFEQSHANDGTCDLILKYSGFCYSDSKTITASVSLPQIDRGMSVSQSLSSKSYNSITMNWSSSSIADYIWYSINGGASWIDVGSTYAYSGSYTITGLSANTTYNIITRARRQDTQINTNYSTTTSVTTYKSPSYVTNVSVGDITPFTCTAFCTSSNASNTSTYEYALCNASGTPLAIYTSNVTYYYFSNLSEETVYNIRCRVQSADSGIWSDYAYSGLFLTPADQSKGYIKINNSWTLGKVYIKINGQWTKSKKSYIKSNNNWNITRNP